MIAGKQTNEPVGGTAEFDPLVRHPSPLEAEAARLRADNATLRARLALLDQALDAMPTHFLIASYAAGGPTITYCNKVVADHHGI